MQHLINSITIRRMANLHVLHVVWTVANILIHIQKLPTTITHWGQTIGVSHTDG